MMRILAYMPHIRFRMPALQALGRKLGANRAKNDDTRVRQRIGGVRQVFVVDSREFDWDVPTEIYAPKQLKQLIIGRDD
jgi:hypothetical protein